MNKYQKGKFISIEGIEGVGKSTNVKFIAQCVQNQGHQVVLTREPGGTPIAEEIRKILLTEYDERTLSKTELLLLYAGRLQHVEHVIKPALHQGKWVVCDRFIDATFAYQGGGREIAIDKIESINKWTLDDFFPDCIIILDAPVEIALARIKTSRQLDRFEKEQIGFFEKIRAQYLARAASDPYHRYHVVDASKPLVEVQQNLKNLVTKIG